MKVGDRFQTNSSGELEIVEYIGWRKVKVRFAETGSEKWVQRIQIEKGKVSDPYLPRLHGIGYVGGGDYTTRVGNKKTRCHCLWSDMLSRCYNKKDRRYPCYGGCGITVCSDWHNFQNFARWYYENYKQGMEMDKDVVNPLSKEYSPENCRFIPPRLNKLIRKQSTISKDLHIGVTKTKYGKYYVQVKTTKKSQYIGTYEVLDDAVSAYCKAKKERISEVAEEEYLAGNIDRDVYESLLNWEVRSYGEYNE